MSDFIGYTSLHCAYKRQHFGYTFADVFADSVLVNFLLRNSQIALSSFRLVLTRVRC